MQLALTAASGRLSRFVHEVLFFERYSLSTPAKDARRRATWPGWRRAVRPIGSTIWWIGVVANVIGPVQWASITVADRVVWVGLLTVLVGCCTIGLVDEFRWRRFDYPRG